MAISRNLSVNPRAQKNLATPIDDTTQKDWSEIIENGGESRVNAYDIEGNFPKSRAFSPEKGIIQYYYALDSTPSRQRPIQKPGYRTPISLQNQNVGYSYFWQNSAIFEEDNFYVYAPRNNDWYETFLFQKKHSSSEQHSKEKGKIKITITTVGYGDTLQDKDRAGTNRFSSTTYEIIDRFPIQWTFTTDPELERGFQDVGYYHLYLSRDTDNIFYAPPGSSIYVETFLQDDPSDSSLYFDHPNEDVQYLGVNYNDASWERGRPTEIVQYTEASGYQIQDDLSGRGGKLNWTWKPTEAENAPTSLKKQRNLYGKVRRLSGSSNFSEEPYFGYMGTYPASAESINTGTGAHTLTTPYIPWSGSNYLPDRIVTRILQVVTGQTLQEADTSSATSHFKAMKQLSTGPNYFPSDFDDSVCTWYAGGNDPKHFWNVQAMNYVLFRSGCRPLRTLDALDYAHYGYEVDWRDWNNVRKYDIAVFKFRNASGGHVGFITDLDLANNKITIKGGNQANKFQESEYLIDNVDMYLFTVRRAWTRVDSATYKLV